MENVGSVRGNMTRQKSRKIEAFTRWRKTMSNDKTDVFGVTISACLNCRTGMIGDKTYCKDCSNEDVVPKKELKEIADKWEDTAAMMESASGTQPWDYKADGYEIAARELRDLIDNHE